MVLNEAAREPVGAFAQPLRSISCNWAGPVQAIGRSQNSEPVRIFELHHLLRICQFGAKQELADGVHGRRRDSEPVEALQPFCCCCLSEFLLDDRLKRGPILFPTAKRSETWIVC